jgi:hypothetical protein
MLRSKGMSIIHHRGRLRLGLLRIEGSRAYLATQHWESREACEAALASASFEAWYDAYTPTLERFHQIMEFEEGWEVEELLD